MILDFDKCYRAAAAKDARFDGWVFCGVTSTGIYCRPSCPARTPHARNVKFYATSAAAQAAGFRSCKRCRPDATPGSPEWDLRADLVGRAMLLIADGVVDHEGVGGLARKLGYTERHVNRQMMAVAGAGPLSIARARRAQTARILIETTKLPMNDIADAAGFSSVRQFNATIQEIFASTPRELRSRKPARAEAKDGAVTLRLPLRKPFDGDGLLKFFAARAVSGIEEVDGDLYRRSLRLVHGNGVVELRPTNDFVEATFQLDDLRDLGPAMQRCRRLFDLDADPAAANDVLGADRLMAPLVASSPGRRVPGSPEGFELALRAILGQQVSIAGAATAASRLALAFGDPLKKPVGKVTHVFPSAAAIAGIDPENLRMPVTRKRAVFALAGAVAEGAISLDGAGDRTEVHEQLTGLTGIGEWTASYIAMRALRDPDAFLPTDLGVHHALEALGEDGSPASATRLAEAWRPYRAYATHHLWASLAATREPRKPAKEELSHVAG